MKEFSINTKSRTQFYEITREVQAYVTEAGIRDGLVTVYVPHTTAGITINENADPDVVADMETVLDRVVPWEGGYRHMEGNTAAHVKASMMGSSAQVLIENGRLCLGTWQGIYFSEFDGPRTRKVWLKGLKVDG
ncbi:MAG: secondary thiamine-phosphate synthase enzyme YjbQ [Verrucomicrobiota bacterium]